MYKSRNYNDLFMLLKTKVTPVINENLKETNLTKADVRTFCNELTNNLLIQKSKALILSYMYLFIGRKTCNIRAGDLVASDFITGLSDNSIFFQYTNKKFSKIFNDMSNSSIPGSVFFTPSFFVTPDRKIREKINNQYNEEAASFLSNKLEGFIDINYESFRNYYFMWFTFNNNLRRLTFFCPHHKDCSRATNFKIPQGKKDFEQVEKIKNEPDRGILYEVNITRAPCLDTELNRKMNISKICNLTKIISRDVKGFLKLMMFTKQNPTEYVDEKEYDSLFQNANYTLENNNFFFNMDKVIDIKSYCLCLLKSC